MRKRKKLVLPDKSEYYGMGFGADRTSVCELVFNTSPVGYQEIISDPSYTDQFVVFAYPLIGNYGINKDDFETKNPSIGGLVVREYNEHPSNFRSVKTLASFMEECGIPGISGVDTREIVRKVRDKGSMRAILCDADADKHTAISELNRKEVPHDAVSRVSRKDIVSYESQYAKYRIACIDFGMKENIIRSFLARGCSVTVFPWNARFDEIRQMNPDGVFLSNGPGDPEDVTAGIQLVKDTKGEYPIFGFCLGHQIISLGLGAKTYKLKFGHRGGNHPVKNLLTGKIEMTSQNHSYAVDEKSLAGTGLAVTHMNLLDGTIEGVRNETERIFSVQYHPESSPGPDDGRYIFDEFLNLMQGNRNAEKN